MGDAVSRERYTPRERTDYRRELNDDLETFDAYLQQAEFVSRGTIGMELELNLVDEQMAPAPVNLDVLKTLDDADFQSEIGSFNFEMNHPVLSVEGDGLRELEDGLRERLDRAAAAAVQHNSSVAMIGTLPTLTEQFLESPEWITPENRYKALSNAVMDSRGELVTIDLADREVLNHDFEDIAPESSCTSMQLHLQVSPERFAEAWNASQAIAGVQAALSANSPLFLGRKVWHESRIPVFAQAIETRPPELIAQGVRPRVWFGERWITSIFDLFEENVRYFPALLPESREESGSPIMRGQAPALHYLNLHNGTVWRWNRPIYAPSSDGLAHVRVENRLLPAGPTVVDMVADAALYYGLVKFLGEQTRPVWSRLPFKTAEKNFMTAARSGLYARQEWPTLGAIDVAKLVHEHLVPQARRGLEKLGVNEKLIDRYMGIIDGRAVGRQNGALWQLRTLSNIRPKKAAPGSPERQKALALMLEQYMENQAKGGPVHTWEIGE